MQGINNLILGFEKCFDFIARFTKHSQYFTSTQPPLFPCMLPVRVLGFDMKNRLLEKPTLHCNCVHLTYIYDPRQCIQNKLKRKNSGAQVFQV